MEEMTSSATPEKVKSAAYHAVRKAIANGTLAPRKDCERCGTSSGTIFGHHEDYSRPIDLVWLCKKCHMLRHRELKWGVARKKTQVTRQFNLRLPEPVFGKLSAMATEKGVSAPTLARMILTEAAKEKEAA